MKHLVFKRAITPPKRRELHAVPNFDDKSERMLKTMEGMLEYLQLTSQERAALEAEPILEEAQETREALESELAELKRGAKDQNEHRALLEGQLRELENRPKPAASGMEETKLRKMLREADEDSATLKTAVVSREKEIALLKEAGTKARREYQERLRELESRPPQVVTQAPTKPEQIDFTYHREMNGLLSRVTLQADGYQDVEVSIVRGADNRMKQLRIGDTP